MINDVTLDWPLVLYDRRALVLELTPNCLFFGADLKKCYWQYPVSEMFQQKCGHEIPAQFREELLSRLQDLFPTKFVGWTPDQLRWATLSKNLIRF